MRLITSFIFGAALIFSPLHWLSAQELNGDNTSDSSQYADAYYVLSSVTITPNTVFELNIDAARERSRWRYRTLKVYPYAIQALELMQELDEVTADMDRKKDRRRYKKQLEEELKETFKNELKHLSRTQGELLINIIERQTERTFYDILKDLKSGTTAFFWQGLGKTYGYNLKEGYLPEANPILEEILTGMEWPDYKPDGYIIHK